MSRDDLATRVTARLGRNPFAANGSLRIEGMVERASGRWTAHIFAREHGQVGDRVLSSDAAECGRFEEAVVLALALVIDPEATFGAAPDTSSTEGARDPDPTPTPQPLERHPGDNPKPPGQLGDTVEAPGSERPAESVHAAQSTLGRVSAGPLVALNILPRATVGASVSGGVAVTSRLTVELGGVFLSESRNADFGFGLTAGRAAGCLHSGPRRWSATACASVLSGAIYGVPYVLEPAQPGARFWLSTSLSASGELRVAGPVHATLGVEGLVTPVRPRFALEGSGQTIFEVPLLGAFAHAGVAVVFR